MGFVAAPRGFVAPRRRGSDGLRCSTAGRHFMGPAEEGPPTAGPSRRRPLPSSQVLGARRLRPRPELHTCLQCLPVDAPARPTRRGPPPVSPATAPLPPERTSSAPRYEPLATRAHVPQLPRGHKRSANDIRRHRALERQYLQSRGNEGQHMVDQQRYAIRPNAGTEAWRLTIDSNAGALVAQLPLAMSPGSARGRCTRPVPGGPDR